MCNGIPCSTYFDLVVPILCYVAEVWGHERIERIERIHLKLCRIILCVSRTTSNVAVLVECGRYLLCIIYHIKCIKYWLNIIEMSENRFVKQCYLINKRLHEIGINTLCTHISNLLNMYGFN